MTTNNMTREQEIAAINKAIAEGRLKKVEYPEIQPTQTTHRVHPWRMDFVGDHQRRKFREKKYKKVGLI